MSQLHKLDEYNYHKLFAVTMTQVQTSFKKQKIATEVWMAMSPELTYF